jgi:hypothetical protein
MRIVILGNAGSGKSTLARSLARTQGMPMLDLDTLVWEPDQVAVQRPDDLVFPDLAQFCRESDDWVIEGCYGDLVEVAAAHATELRFLNPGIEACVANCRARPWEPSYCASPEDQARYLGPLIDFVRQYETRQDEYGLARHRAIFEAFTGTRCELP